MKRRLKFFVNIVLMIGTLSIILTGCNNSRSETNLEITEAISEISLETPENFQETENSKIEVLEEKNTSNNEAAVNNNIDVENNFEENTENTDFSYNFFTVKNPGFIYYNDGSVDINNPSETIILKEWYKKANDIVDEHEWFQKINAEISRWNYEDENYRYELSDVRICIYSLDGKLIADFDFSQFRYGEEYIEEDFPFIDQRITHAKARDGVLYVATSHNTYSSSCSQNAYITAVDMADGHVIWKTESLTCNSYNFEIIDDNIVCGHGFTDEKDYLKIIDRKTGLVLEEIPVASQIYYLILKDDMLYVRTYNTDYCFVVLTDERDILIPEGLEENTPKEQPVLK